MAISSMTGFARVDGADEGMTWAWEARSVNGRGLDVRLRLPPGLDSLEPQAREAALKRFARGNVSISLALERHAGAAAVRLNEALLRDLIRASKRAAELVGGPTPDAASLLAIKGVLETSDGAPDNAEQRGSRDAALLSGLTSALDGLQSARRAEGDRLLAILSDHVAQIEALVRAVRASPSRSADAIRMRLREMTARILESADGLDPDRLHQEAVIAATRADVEEELARLEAHIEAARDILAVGAAAANGGVGRKLDFLAQEFNREANTLCSKANSVDVTRLGLSLKTVIDQFREQVQNVE